MISYSSLEGEENLRYRFPEQIALLRRLILSAWPSLCMILAGRSSKLGAVVVTVSALTNKDDLQ